MVVWKRLFTYVGWGCIFELETGSWIFLRTSKLVQKSCISGQPHWVMFPRESIDLSSQNTLGRSRSRHRISDGDTALPIWVVDITSDESKQGPQRSRINQRKLESGPRLLRGKQDF